MKKILLLSLAAGVAVAANAQYVPGETSIMSDYRGQYTLTVEWAANDAGPALGANSRAGVGVNDKFYFPVTGKNYCAVYDQMGFVKNITYPSAAATSWVSATADNAGHVLMRTSDDPWPGTGVAYAGCYYPNQNQGVYVIDSETDAILGFCAFVNGATHRFDALGHVNADVVNDDFWEFPCGGELECNDFIFNGMESQGCEPFPVVIDGAFAGTAAASGQTLGTAQIYGQPNEDGMVTTMAMLANPYIGVTGSGGAGLGNSIQVYNYVIGDGSAMWTPEEKFFITPQHAGMGGFVIFEINGEEYIAYPSGESADGTTRVGDALAISKVAYTTSPVSQASDEDYLIARLYGSDSNFPPGSNFLCLNVEPVAGDPNSVYIYMFCQQCPTIKLKFTAPTTGIESVVDKAEDKNAPVEYYNLQGIRVSNPDNGIFIKKQGNTVTKIAL